MSNVIPLFPGHSGDEFRTPGELLAEVLAEVDISGFAIFIRRPDGMLVRAQFDMSRPQMAMVALAAGAWALEPGEELEA